MSTSIINDADLKLDRYGQVFVITMCKAPENRLSKAYCQKLIRTFHRIQEILGAGVEGAVITKGNDAKFWCTVRVSFSQPIELSEDHLEEQDGVVEVLC